MTPEQVRGAVQDAQVFGREVTIDTPSGTFTGRVSFVGSNVFRLDPGATFFDFHEVQDVA